MSPIAERIWQAGEDYTRLAMEHLSNYSRSQTDEIARREALRVSFLFPNLPQRAYHDLCDVRRRYLGVAQAQRNEVREQNQPSASAAEYCEAEAVDWQKDAQEALSAFTPVQQEILREKFFVRSS